MTDQWLVNAQVVTTDRILRDGSVLVRDGLIAGLGTIFMGIMLVAAALLRRDRLLHHRARPVLWALMLSSPLPFIANTAGWMTTELGRQPWLVYGIMRTADGYSNKVSASNALFTLLGFMGVYALLSLLFAFVMYRILEEGPEQGASSDPLAAGTGG